MVSALLPLLALAATSAALKVTSPSSSDVWTVGDKETVEWEAVSSDQDTFNIYLSNMASYPTTTILLASDVSSSAGSATIDGSKLKTGDSYTINFTNGTETEQIYAQSSQFNITEGDSSSSSSSSASSTASSSSSTGTAVTFTLSKVSSTGSQASSSSTATVVVATTSANSTTTGSSTATATDSSSTASSTADSSSSSSSSASSTASGSGASASSTTAASGAGKIVAGWMGAIAVAVMAL